jgi:hypothetical protein
MRPLMRACDSNSTASAIAVNAYRGKTRRSLAATLTGETDFLISGSILYKHS